MQLKGCEGDDGVESMGVKIISSSKGGGIVVKVNGRLEHEIGN